MTLTVSTVIPAYNSATTLPRALESALGQSIRTRVIVVDDGSTDNTPAVLRRYGSKISVIRQENRGAGAARSAGTRLADTDLIAYLDADDAWHPGKLERQLRVFADPDVGLASSAAQWIDATGAVVRVSRPALHGYVTRQLLLRNPIVTSSAVVRRNFIERLSTLFRPELFPVEDWELWIRLSAICKVSVSPEVQVDYYVMDAGGSRSRGPEDFRRLYKLMFAQLGAEPGVGSLIADDAKKISANVHFMVAYMYYEEGSYTGFRKEVMRSVAMAPGSHPWRNTLPMLLLPRAAREKLRRLMARLGRSAELPAFDGAQRG
ncbi:MAG TPA: glycosyltransferase family A protein [Gemmatimonadaceae bacterium]|nr:glycosyltransferase family A protein [Gemmatimonadaceae bacterium]